MWGEVVGNVNNMWSAVVVSDDNDVNMCVIVRNRTDHNCTTGQTTQHISISSVGRARDC